MDFVKTKVLQENIVEVLIDKEKSLNSLNTQVLKELSKTFDSDLVQTARVVILRGAGEKAFVAGADIAEMKDFNSIQAKEFSELGHTTFSKLEKLKAVTVTVVQGFALGGGFELALSTDVIFASEKAKFGLPEVSLGLIPGFGGTQRLSRSLGVHMAKALILSGDMVVAKELCSKGLVYKVLGSGEETLKEATEFAKRVVSKGPHSVSVAKQALQGGHSLAFKKALSLEQQEFSLLFGTVEANEGIAAFLEKRKPKF